MFAVFAFSAVAAASAFAEGKWLLNGAAAPANTPVDSTGTLLLEDMTFKTDVTCSGLFGGTVATGGVAQADEITTVVDLEGKTPLSCTLTEKGACTEANGSLILVTPVNLPWKTELLLNEEKPFLDDILGSPGYLIECTTILGKIDDTCTGATSTEEKNVAGGVEGIFSETETITPPGNCTQGGTAAGLVVGKGVTTPTGGGTLTVSE
jgi:hypothetical protein